MLPLDPSRCKREEDGGTYLYINLQAHDALEAV